jgi:quercetin dioxygenase-like cupin family protein
MKARILPAAAMAALLLAPALNAQAPTIKRTLLQRIDLGDGRELILGLAEIVPGGSTGRHTHFGLETGFAISGTSSMEIEGEPARLMRAGETYLIPAGKVHDARAVGSEPAKVLAVYVVEKGKPLATPVPPTNP